jgi:hypothetical protein
MDISAEMQMEIKQTGPNTEELLPWHKPEVQRLVVNVDTQIGAGSGIDGPIFEPGGPG